LLIPPWRLLRRIAATAAAHVIPCGMIAIPSRIVAIGQNARINSIVLRMILSREESPPIRIRDGASQQEADRRGVDR
jgi:hypothetical protein